MELLARAHTNVSECADVGVDVIGKAPEGVEALVLRPSTGQSGGRPLIVQQRSQPSAVCSLASAKANGGTPGRPSVMSDRSGCTERW
jgi:hypothetical protein